MGNMKQEFETQHQITSNPTSFRRSEPLFREKHSRRTWDVKSHEIVDLCRFSFCLRILRRPALALHRAQRAKTLSRTSVDSALQTSGSGGASRAARAVLVANSPFAIRTSTLPRLAIRTYVSLNSQLSTLFKTGLAPILRSRLLLRHSPQSRMRER